MKKYDEGYALPFVLVVLLVMMVLAVGVMDFSLRNLESQKNTTQRMTAKYEAAGKIEEIVSVMTTKRTKQQETNGENKEVLDASIVFEETESLSFVNKNGVLRIAAASRKNGDAQPLWIIAAIKPETWNADVTGNGFGTDDVTLTINYCGKIQYLWYEIVDADTARNFIAPGNGVPPYDPY